MSVSNSVSVMVSLGFWAWSLGGSDWVLVGWVGEW